jgi:hypothetical protein
MRLKRNGVDVGRRPRIVAADQELPRKAAEDQCKVCLRQAEIVADGRCATCAGTAHS